MTRPITFVGDMPKAYTWTRQLYEDLGADDRIRVIGSAARSLTSQGKLNSEMYLLWKLCRDCAAVCPIRLN
jgi:hypothetical protein